MSPTQTTQSRKATREGPLGSSWRVGRAMRIKKAEYGGCGIGHDLLDGAEKGAVDEKSEGEDAEDGGGAVGPLEVDAE